MNLPAKANNKLKHLVKIARETVERYFESKKLTIKHYPQLKEKRGIFVTIKTYPNGELRGCVGFPLPFYSLGEGVQRAAYAAAFEDTRFPPLEKEELEKVVFEVSILTTPKLIKVRNPKEYLEKIEPGKDGLILKHGIHQGLFLPQVWKEIPDKENFLSSLCFKALLPPDCWLDEKTRIYKFRVKSFKEEKPKGKIEEGQ